MTDRELFENVELYMGKDVVLEGWIKNHRKQKEFGFISFSDGTFFTPVQIVYEKDLKSFEEIQKYHNGSAIRVEGVVVESPKEGQEFEIHAKKSKTSEVKLITRYIKEGMMRDSNQTTLDEIE